MECKSCSLRRVGFVSALAIGVLSAGYLVYRAQAATDSGSVILQGTVAPVVAITVTPVGSYNNLDITTQQTVTALQVATVSEQTNVAYTVTVGSANLTSGNCTVTTSPCLYNPVGAGSRVQIDLSIAGSAVTFNTNPKQYKTGGVEQTGTTPDSVNITYTIGQAYPAGTYAETLTFTISSV